MIFHPPGMTCRGGKSPKGSAVPGLQDSCYCGSPLLSLAAGDADCDIRQCPACGYLRSTYRQDVSRRLIQEEHPSAYQGRDGRRFGSLVGSLRAACAAYRVRRALLGSKGRGRIVDFGCGQGYFLQALQAAGHDCVGIEISEVTAGRAMSKGLRVENSLDALAGHSFSGAASVHVIEHLPDPGQILDGLRRVVEPDGSFYFEVPNLASWQGRLFGRFWLHREAGLHIHHFTPRAFAGLLAAHGYRIEKLGTYSFEHGLLGWVQSFFNLVFPYNRFFRLVVLNRPLADKLRCWPEILIFPIVLAVSGVLLVVEALAGRGAVLRVEGRITGPAA
jgi:2-polyprenyl-3-methyl-5-hydroxy-6-metoxy-1,4-benzoquinol methylase